MKKKRFAMAAVCAVMTIALAGCSMLSSKLNDITGKLVGNSYTITTYDNYGNRVMTTTGDKINVQGNAVETSSYDSDGNVITGYELSSVITITIDGKEIESCGDTCIFAQDALKADVDFTQEDIESNASGKITDNTAIAGVLNKYKNMFGKARVVVIKSQLGQPIVAYSGEDVYLLPAGAEAHVGRMDSGEMEALMRAGGYSLAVDATHPYAVEVTEHIRAAAEAAGLPVLRLVRQPDGGELCRRAKDMAGAADMLEQMPGHVLLTTGSKELHHFARPGLAERCYPRVLPMADSLERCLTLGFPPKNIICMQGPFSRELNVALLRQYHIQTLVTKDTGGYGGFREKAEAAREAGCALLVVERPSRETGLTLEEIQKKIMEEENA